MLVWGAPDNRSVDDLTKEFLLESLEGLDRMQQSLAELERDPGDAELIGEVFRAVHTIKGTTGFLGFHRLESLSHAGENLLSQVRDGRVRVSGEVIEGLLQLMDGLRHILNLIDMTGDEGKRVDDDDADLILALRSLQEDGGRQNVADPLDWIRALAPEDIAAIEAVCPPPVLREETARTLPQRAGPSARGAAFSSGAVAMELPMSVPPRAAQVLDGSSAGRGAAEARSSAAEARSSAAESTLRVDVELLNRMMNLVGELVLTRNRILQTTSGDAGFAVLGRRLDMVTAELRACVMKARMQPVGYLFQKFPRMVRDLARTCGRQVRLELEGEETELDKSLLEAVRDPITHAIRNAVDHGIEPGEERAAAGKPAEGVLRLAALQQGGHIVIEVCDDGAGISDEKILAKALERNLISAEKAALLKRREVLQLVFLPGFSTAAEVTNISGRGVGMDVVRTNVEKIGGTVELESEPGVGTRLRMRIPLTLAIVPALVVVSGSQSFAIPQSALSELVRLTPREAEEAIEWVDRTPVYRLRDHLLPLVWMDALLGLKKAEAEGGRSAAAQAGGDGRRDGNLYIAVLEADGRSYGLVVDELLEPEEIVVKPLTSVLRQEGLFSGAAVLGNGTLALIVDPGAAAARAGLMRRGAEREMAEGGGAGRQHGTAGNLEQGGAGGGLESLFLVFDAGRCDAGAAGVACGAALPLKSVERIETVAYRRIEFAGGRALLQFRGRALPLADPGGLLGEVEASGDPETEVKILICAEEGDVAGGGQRELVGVVVRQVTDVISGRLLEGNAAGGRQGAAAESQRRGLAVLNGRVTAIFDLAGACGTRLVACPQEVI